MNQRDPTPERLVLAARKLFADKGFDRASVRAITRAARANLGAVTYHFGSKDRLRDEVLDRIVAGMAHRVQAVAGLSVPARERVGRIVQAIFDYSAEHPDAPRLVARFLVHNEPARTPILAPQRVLLGSIVQVIAAGTGGGEFRAVDPFLGAFSLLSQCIWFHLVRGPAAQLSGRPFERPEGASVMAAHITDVILRALAPDAS